MWRTFFEIMYGISYLIPVPRWRRYFRRVKLFDYRAKLRALYTARPDLKKHRMRLAKGGGSLAFIFDNQYVFKVRKYCDRDNSATRFAYEKRITDAIAPVLNIKVPQIDIIAAGEFLFYATTFIPGRVLVDLPLKRIREHREKIGKQLGDVIFTLFNTKFPQLNDIRAQQIQDQDLAQDDVGLTHGDMCSNIIVNPATMDLVGIIDWEYAGYSSVKRDFIGIFRVRRKMRQTDIAPEAMWEYYRRMRQNNTKTKGK